MEAENTRQGDTGATQPDVPVLVGEFLRGEHMILCDRYHVKLTQAACDQYRDRNRDACLRCPNRHPIRERRFWAREQILQTLEEYSRAKGRPISLRELTDEFGFSSATLRRQWGSWKALRAAARQEFPRRGPWIHDPVTRF